MDPVSANHIANTRLEMRLEVLDRSDAKQDAAIARLDERLDASEKREVAMNAALQHIIDARKLINGALVTQVVTLGLGLLFIVPVAIDRLNNHSSSKTPLTISK